MSLIVDREMARYGVTANAIATSATTRMTVDAMGRGKVEEVPPEILSRSTPAHVSPLVVWLASERAGHIHGEVFRAGNGRVNLFRGWQAVRRVGSFGHPVWDPEELGAVMEKEFFADPPPRQTMEDVIRQHRES